MENKLEKIGQNSFMDNFVKTDDILNDMYDDLKRSEGDNPTIGIVLCSDTDDDIARYSVMHGNEQLFASKYKLYLPTKEELKAEIETQKAMFYLQQQDNEEKETEQNLCRRSAQIALNKKAFMCGNFQWNKNDRYVVSVLWSEG